MSSAALDDYLFRPPGDKSDEIKKGYQAVHRAGLTDVEVVDRAPIPLFDTRTALRFPHQGQFHPLKYLDGLARAIERHGAKIFCRTHAADLAGGEKAHVTTSAGHKVSSQSIVVATNTVLSVQRVLCESIPEADIRNTDS